jgi:hypothetical protein
MTLTDEQLQKMKVLNAWLKDTEEGQELMRAIVKLRSMPADAPVDASFLTEVEEAMQRAVNAAEGKEKP